METASSKCAACVSSLKSACSAFKGKDTAEGRLLGDQSGDELERLGLWMGNIGVLHPPSSPLSLESRLKEAQDVLAHILELLDNVYEAAVDLQQLAEDHNGETDKLLEDGTPDDEGDDNSEAEADEDEPTALIHEIGSYITRLFRATKIIRQAAPTDRFTKAMTRQRVKLNDQFDIAHVGEKFPKLATDDQTWLRQRLGRAITHRRQYLRYAREHKEKLEAIAQEEIDLAKAATKDFVSTRASVPAAPARPSGSQPSTFFTKATTVDAAKVASALLSADLASDQEEDARSYTTISRSVDGDLDSSLTSRIPALHEIIFAQEFGETTFVSVGSTPPDNPVDAESVLEAPAIINAHNMDPNTLNPAELRKAAKDMTEHQFKLVHKYATEQGYYARKEIECPFCRQVRTFKNDRAWRRHVYTDLRPYVCTFADCDMSYFSDVNEWFRHEMQSHRVSFSCRLCSGKEFRIQSHYLAHIQRHHPALIIDGDDKAILDIGKKPLLDIPAAHCPCCTDWIDRLRKRSEANDVSEDIHVTITVFKRHLASHLEQLALFALPLPSTIDGNMDSNLAVELGTDQDQHSEEDSLQFDSRPESPASSTAQESDPDPDNNDSLDDYTLVAGCKLESRRCSRILNLLREVELYEITSDSGLPMQDLKNGIESCGRLLTFLSGWLLNDQFRLFTVMIPLDSILPSISKTLRDITQHYDEQHRLSVGNAYWKTLFIKMDEETEGMNLLDRFKFYEDILRSMVTMISGDPSNFDASSFEQANENIMRLRAQQGIPPTPSTAPPLAPDVSKDIQSSNANSDIAAEPSQHDELPSFSIETEHVTDPEPPPSEADSGPDESVDGQLTSVYELRDNEWCGRGIGFCKGLLGKTKEGTSHPQIIVRSEKDLKHVILQTKVDPSFEFGVQRGDSIVWSEPSDGGQRQYMALCFKESQSCSIVWEWISEVLKLSDNGEDKPLQLNPSLLDEEYVARIKEEIFDEIKTREVLSPSILDSQQGLALFSPETLLESIACSSRRNAHTIMQRALETPDMILGGKPELTESILMLMVANRDHASMFVRIVMSMRPEDVIVTVDVLTEALRNYLHTRALLEILPLPSFDVTFLSSRIVSLAARREPLGLSDFFGYLSRWAKEGNLGQDQSKALFRLTQIYLDAEFGRESQKSLLFQRYCTKLESPQVTGSREEAEEEGDAPRSLTVLVADDHPVSRLVLEGVLDDLGCQTTSASNGAEALTHLIGDVKFDIAFLEPRLPRISGADVAQMARRGSKTQRINTDTPLIAVTAHENEFVKGEGFDALLLKPATRRNVIELLTLYCRWKPRHVPETVSVPSQTEYDGDTFMDKDGMVEMLETGRVFLEAGKYHEAEASLNIVINNPLIMHPQGSAWIKHPQRIQASFGLARLYLLQQRDLESEELGREVVKLTTEVLGEDDEDLFDRQIVLAIALKARRKDLDAAKLLADALDLRQKHLGADAQTTELTSLLHQWNEDTYPSTERSTAVEYEAKALVEEHIELLRQLPFSRRRKARNEDGPSSSFAQRA